MIVFENEHEYATRVLNILGDEYKHHLTEKKVGIDAVRLRFLVFQGYANDTDEQELADLIKQKFPIIEEENNDE